MRQIKFSAWDGKKMQQVHLLGLHWELENDPPIYIDIPSGEVPHYSDCPLMQYTGLKDKNGVEIYEGDIVKDDYGDLYAIQYEGYSFNENPLDHAEYCEVIGNIYENPELLK